MIIENPNTKESVQLSEINLDDIKRATDLLNDDPTSMSMDRHWNFYGGNNGLLAMYPGIGNINFREEKIIPTYKSIEKLADHLKIKHEKWVEKVKEMYPDEIYNEDYGCFESQMDVTKTQGRWFPSM